MYDQELLLERLESILEALERIPLRFASIETANDFLATEEGREHLDSISMVLLAVGEAFKKIDDKTKGQYLTKYPEISWKEVIGMRNVLAHDYFGINERVIFFTCKEHVIPMTEIVRKMIADISKSS